MPHIKSTLIRTGSLETHSSGKNIVATNLRFSTPPPGRAYTHCTITQPTQMELVGSFTATIRREVGTEHWAGDGPAKIRLGGRTYKGHIDLFFPGNAYGGSYHGYKPSPSVQILLPGRESNAAIKPHYDRDSTATPS